MTTNTRPRSTKKFKALIAAGLSETDAFAVMGVDGNMPNDAEPDALTQLVDAGFTQDEAAKILADRDTGKGKKKKGKKAKAQAPEALTPKQEAEALVASKGLTFTRGRVYGGASLAEALVRVMKTGSAEIVTSSGVGRVSAVLVYRETSGDVAMQNLSKPV